MVSPPDQQHFGACFCSSSLPCFFTVVGDIFCHFPRDCGFFFQYILRMKYLLIVNHICYLQQRFWLIYFGCYLTLFFCLKVIYFYPYIQICLFSIIIFFRKTQNCFIFLGRTSRFHFYFLCICQTLWHILYAQKILSLLKEEFKGKLWE